MVNRIQKFLKKLSSRDREKVLDAMERVRARNFEGLSLRSLAGRPFYFRIRVGRVRVVYFDDEVIEKPVIIGVTWRDDLTYKRLF